MIDLAFASAAAAAATATASSLQFTAAGASPHRRLSLYHPSLLPLRFAATFSHFLQCHAHLAVSGLLRDHFAASRLLKLSSALAPLSHTLLLFLHLPSPADTFTVNTLLRSISLSPSPALAIRFYTSFLRSGFSPNSFTFPSLASACARAGAALLDAGEAVHAQAVRRGVHSLLPVSNSLVHMYAACGLVSYARVLFDEMSVKDLVSWNSIVDGYVKVGDLTSARRLFDGMPEKNVVSWNVMINGYLKGRCPESGLVLFREMGRKRVVGSVKTLVSIATACGRLGAFREGESVHGYFVRNFREKNLIFETALVDMYSKCKRVDVAKKVFDGIVARNLVCWNAMILGHCFYACVEDGLQLFDEMVQLDKASEERGADYVTEIKPDETTFVGVLFACARAGLLDGGKKYFSEMTSTYNVKPTFAHYWCMANLYGGLGLVQEAEEVLRSMPMDDESLVWSSLLWSCRFHGDIELGEQIGKKLIELEPYNSSRYSLLWNIYMVAKRWEDVEKVKELMKERGIKAMPGHSLLDWKEIVHNFKVGDQMQPEMGKIYSMMDNVVAIRLTNNGLKSNQSELS